MTARTAEKKTALRLPERFRQLKSLHGDPPMSVPYGYVSEGTESFLFVSPVEKRDAAAGRAGGRGRRAHGRA